MFSSDPANWLLIEERSVEGLGHGELFQSSAQPLSFLAKLVLNSYESNCLRDWLSQRWVAKSLEQSCVFLHDHSRLLISLTLPAESLSDAKEKFVLWLHSVALDRIKSQQSRV